MELNIAANVWSVGVPLGGTFFMWLILRAATYRENNPNGRFLITLVCILIFLTVFSFIKLIGIG
ncbi:MAG: hypothetical protein GY805_16970 [Chloroflexi bacterium]|nr:hypothetical protein [Chloroflexota bacterium]